jgi:hypothetical protein
MVSCELRMTFILYYNYQIEKELFPKARTSERNNFSKFDNYGYYVLGKDIMVLLYCTTFTKEIQTNVKG